MILVGNKVDLEGEREVSSGEGKALAQDWSCPFMETSAKNKGSVDELFAEIVRQMNYSTVPSGGDQCCSCALLWTHKPDSTQGVMLSFCQKLSLCKSILTSHCCLIVAQKWQQSVMYHSLEVFTWQSTWMFFPGFFFSFFYSFVFDTSLEMCLIYRLYRKMDIVRVWSHIVGGPTLANQVLDTSASFIFVLLFVRQIITLILICWQIQNNMTVFFYVLTIWSW